MLKYIDEIKKIGILYDDESKEFPPTLPFDWTDILDIIDNYLDPNYNPCK